MVPIGIVLPIHVDFSNYGELLPSFQRAKAETGATHFAQYLVPPQPVTDAAQNKLNLDNKVDLIVGFLNTCQAVGATAMIGFKWIQNWHPAATPIPEIYEPIFSTPGIRDHVALKEVQILDEPHRRKISTATTKSHYDRMKAILPGKDLLLAVSNEWGRWPETAAADLADIIQFSCLEHRLNPTTSNCNWQHNDTLTLQKKGREVAASLGYTRLQSTLQGWVGASYCFTPFEDFKTEVEVLTGPDMGPPIEKIMIQRWAGEGTGSESRETFFSAPEFAPHREYLLSLNVLPEPTQPTDTITVYQEGTIVKEDGDYVGLTVVARKAGETFPKSASGNRAYIRVQKEE